MARELRPLRAGPRTGGRRSHRVAPLPALPAGQAIEGVARVAVEPRKLEPGDVAAQVENDVLRAVAARDGEVAGCEELLRVASPGEGPVRLRVGDVPLQRRVDVHGRGSRDTVRGRVVGEDDRALRDLPVERANEARCE